jgi:1-acyl-sn-glycerol-3-phosphate acyltransferase
VAFGVVDHKWGTEKLVIVAETKEERQVLHKKIISEINEKVNVVLGVFPDEVILVSPKTISKTSSGKLQRAACKQAYLDNTLRKARLPISMQIAKIYAKSTVAKIHNGSQFLLKGAYSLYVGSLFLLSMLGIWTLALILKPKPLATFCKKWARIGLHLIGCPLTVIGKEHIAAMSPCVYVANHASYVDAVVLLAILPAGTLFVGKKELLKVPFLKTIMKKMNTITVNRMDFSSNLSESNEIAEMLRQGKSVALFPEGGFSYATGLRPFKLGAFKVAVETHTSVCPIALQGTRHMMRGDNPILTPQRITVTIGEKIYPTSNEWQEVTLMHTQARQMIAEHCGEPAIDY